MRRSCSRRACILTCWAGHWSAPNATGCGHTPSHCYDVESRQGSILTVDPSEAKALGRPRLRRYIYKISRCPRCSTHIQTWQIANRRCYACPRCQPVHDSDRKSTVITNAAKSTKITKTIQTARVAKVAKTITISRTKSRTASRTTSHANTEKENCVPFNSHCAPESVAERLQADGPGRLTIREIRSELHRRSQTILTNSKKAVLVKQLEHVLSQDAVMISAEDDAMEKAMVGESLAVEQLAELGPSQARKVRQRAAESAIAIAIKREPITVESSTDSEDD